MLISWQVDSADKNGRQRTKTRKQNNEKRKKRNKRNKKRLLEERKEFKTPKRMNK
jgi:hypothetical protein